MLIRTETSRFNSIVHSNTSFWQNSKKFFNTAKESLPNLMASFTPKKVDPFIKTTSSTTDLFPHVWHEFNNNIFAKNILLNTEKLIGQKKLIVSQATSLQDAEKDYMNRSSVFNYNNKDKVIRIPDSINTPYVLMPFLNTSYHNFHSNRLSYFIGAFLHECLHAVDDLVADLSITAKDRRFIQAEYEWLPNGTEFEYYEKPEMRAFVKAIINDKKSLAARASKGDAIAERFLHFINLIDSSYSRYDFLDEMKAFLIQFTVKGAFEVEQVQNYLPAMSDWYLNTFTPLIQKNLVEHIAHTPKI